MKFINKFLSFILIISLTIASDIKIPQTIKSSILKQYEGEDIKFLSIKKIGSVKFRVIIQTEYGKDKVIINKKGKIFSISEYLNDLEPTGGC
ncbi:hypothetical protein ACKGJI_11405 [Sulfurospirillum sp. 1307]|jgi:uncharacterized membrane protein